MTALPLEPHTEADQRIADIEAAPYAPESAVERVARAIWESQPGTMPWEGISELTRSKYRLRAPVVIGAMKGPGLEAEALARVEALADELGRVPHIVDPLVTRVGVARRIRAAIAAPVAQAGEGR